MSAAHAEKQEVRERIWHLLEAEGASRFPGAHGRIPNFHGAEQAAGQLAAAEAWRRARVIKANPDAPQLPLRARALAEGRTVYMAVPRLRSERPFIVLDPERLEVPPRKAASIRGAGRHGVYCALEEVPRVDLVVCGSVAVNADGVRVGKGGGFSDLELALLIEAGRIDADTVIATTVHPLQIVDGPLPETAHDFRVDVIATPQRCLDVPRPRRPPGVLWAHLSEAKIRAIPAPVSASPFGFVNRSLSDCTSRLASVNTPISVLRTHRP